LGWIKSLVQATVATSGVAASFIHASHVKRTRYAHTVTAAALFISLKRCYASHVKQNSDGIVLDFDSWCSESQNLSVQFKFWYTAKQLEMLASSFIRSLREGNFELYVDCLRNLIPWFFVNDQTIYARWLPVDLRDMLSLEQKHPGIYTAFMSGNFTISKSNNSF